MKRPTFLIVKTGSAHPDVVQTHGDYDRWFTDALGAPERFRVVSVVNGEPFPSTRDVDALLVTGSALSACQPEPWMVATGDRLLEEAARGKPVLGICFGHQLLATAHGTPVIVNPRGREIGTVTVSLTQDGREDPLFAGLGPKLRVLATHSDVVSKVPPGARLLAANENTPVQALAYGSKIRSLQFHPELTAPALTSLLRTRIEPIRSEGLDPEAIESGIEPTPAAALVLRNFEEHFV